MIKSKKIKKKNISIISTDVNKYDIDVPKYGRMLSCTIIKLYNNL